MNGFWKAMGRPPHSCPEHLRAPLLRLSWVLAVSLFAFGALFAVLSVGWVAIVAFTVGVVQVMQFTLLSAERDWFDRYAHHMSPVDLNKLPKSAILNLEHYVDQERPR